MGFLLHPPRKMGENFLQGLFFLAFFCYHFYNAMASIHKTAPKSKWRMSKLKINKERRKHFSFLSSWVAILSLHTFPHRRSIFQFSFSTKPLSRTSNGFLRLCTTPKAESTDTHIFNGNLFRIYIFCFYASPLCLPRAATTRPTISISENHPSRGKFFQLSHTHTKRSLFLASHSSSCSFPFFSGVFNVCFTVDDLVWVSVWRGWIVTISHILITFYCLRKYFSAFMFRQEHLLLLRPIWGISSSGDLNFCSEMDLSKSYVPASISALREIQMKIPNKNTQNGDWKHYTSNCEKIVKCGRVSATRSFHSIVFHSTTRPTISDGRQKFYFVALLLSISHFQGATLDTHKFGCWDIFMNEFFVAFDLRVDIEPSGTTNMHIMMFCLSFLMTKKERERGSESLEQISCRIEVDTDCIYFQKLNWI